MSNELVPFIKWVGGKRWLSNIILDITEELDYERYLEPFLGGGATFLALNPKYALLSDINEELVSFYRTISEQPEKVISRFKKWPNNKKQYYKIRSLRTDDEIMSAARLLYLNRTCFGGIYRTNKEGEFNTPFGYYDRKLLNEKLVYDVSKRFKKSKILAQDFRKTLEIASENDLIYLDPPYLVDEKNSGFNRYAKDKFKWVDQLELIDLCNNIKVRGSKLIVSALNSDAVKQKFKGWYYLEVYKSHAIKNIDGKKSVSEIILLSWKPKRSVYASALNLIE